MAGWSYTGATRAVGAYKGMDSSLKVAAFPTLAAGNASWWQEFAFRVGQDFARELKSKTAAATLIVSANNGAGDTNGVGVALTITLTTA